MDAASGFGSPGTIATVMGRRPVASHVREDLHVGQHPPSDALVSTSFLLLLVRHLLLVAMHLFLPLKKWLTWCCSLKLVKRFHRITGIL